MNNWTRVTDQLPPDGVVVEIITDSGMGTTLKRSGGLWFVPDGSIYVYYTPMMWRYVD